MNPGRYRKKPVVIEAMRITAYTDLLPPFAWNDGNYGAVWRWLNEHGEVLTAGQDPGGPAYGIVHTLEGKMRADVGDWIIRGVAGEFYPCKPDIFAATYEAEQDPIQGRGDDLDRAEGDGAPVRDADAGVVAHARSSDGPVGHDHGGTASEPEPAQEGDRASDPPGAAHSANTTCGICGAPAVRTRVLVPVRLISPPPRQVETHVEFRKVQCLRVQSHVERGERPCDITEIGDNACPVM